MIKESEIFETQGTQLLGSSSAPKDRGKSPYFSL